MLLTSDPIPIKATTSAAPAKEEPRSRALSGMIGKMAPSPIPNIRDGPNAGRAMDHKLKSPGFAVLLTGSTLRSQGFRLPSFSAFVGAATFHAVRHRCSECGIHRGSMARNHHRILAAHACQVSQHGNPLSGV